MKARYEQKMISTKHENMIREAAKRQAELQMDDIAIRCQYLVFAAMVDCGISPEKVNEVIDCLGDVKEKYKDYRIEELADYIFYNRLRDAGVNVKPTSHEPAKLHR